MFYSGEMAPDQLFELRRRTFDTPQFRGIEFIEVEAKSIVNPVPGNYLPFNWTIPAQGRVRILPCPPDDAADR